MQSNNEQINALSIGRPSAGGLHFPEYVVYRGEQVRNTTRQFKYFLLSFANRFSVYW